MGNGSTVVFTSTTPMLSNSDGSQEVFLIHSDGSGLVALTRGTVPPGDDPNQAINGIAISEDGTLVALSSSGNYTQENPFISPQIFSVRNDGSGIDQLTTFTFITCEVGGRQQCSTAFVTPTLSVDGNKIGFVRVTVNVDNLAERIPQNTDPFLMNADGSGQVQPFDTTTPQQLCSLPALMEDGSLAAFSFLDGSAGTEQLVPIVVETHPCVSFQTCEEG